MKIIVVHECDRCPLNKHGKCQIDDEIDTEYLYGYIPNGCPLENEEYLIAHKDNIDE